MVRLDCPPGVGELRTERGVSRRSFGSVRQRSSQKWEARYRDSSGKVLYQYFTTKAGATAYLATTEADMLRGDWIDPRRAAVTVSEVAAEFMASKRKLRSRTVELYEYLIDHHINPAFGTRPLSTVTTESVDNWMMALAAKESIGPSTEAKALRLFSQIMQFAVQQRRIAFNPCANVEAPEVATKTMPFLTEVQVGALAERIGAIHGWRQMVLLAAYGGLRWGECTGLDVAKVDLLRNRVHVDEQLQRDGALGPPKSEKSVRRVGIPKWLGDELSEAIASRTPAADLPDHHRGLLFLTADGTALVHSSTWNRKVWRPAVVASLPAHLHHLRFHDLRHTAVAIALETSRKSGRPLNAKQLQERMGHSTIRMTLDRYGHLLDGHDDEVVAAMANPFALLEAQRASQAGTVVPLRASDAS